MSAREIAERWLALPAADRLQALAEDGSLAESLRQALASAPPEISDEERTQPGRKMGREERR